MRSVKWRLILAFPAEGSREFGRKARVTKAFADAGPSKATAGR